MAKTTEMCCKEQQTECPVTGCGRDFLTRALNRVHVSRSLLVTLALVPFAWDGVLWFRDAFQWVWDSVSAWQG